MAAREAERDDDDRRVQRAVRIRTLRARLASVQQRAQANLGDRYGRLFLLALIVGVLAALGSGLLRFGVDAATTLFFAYPAADATLGARIAAAPWWVILVVPALGGLLVGLLTRHAHEVAYSGEPMVMLSTSAGDGRIRDRVAPLKVLATSFTLGSGGSAGREGPVSYIGGALGSLVGRYGRLRTHDLKIIVASGASAAIAAMFNAPLGGVMFSLELFLTEFSTRAFIPLVAATVLSVVVTNVFLTTDQPYGIPAYDLVSGAELVLYLMLGLLSGLVAVLLVRTVRGGASLFDRLPLPAWALPAVGGLGTGAMGTVLLFGLGEPFVLGAGYDLVGRVFDGSLGPRVLVLVLVAKLLATASTCSSRGSGGLFGPSLVLGALAGGLFGLTAQAVPWFPVAPPGAYAAVGMAAVFAGASRATLAAILIVFEITGQYEIILPLMFACVVSDAVAVAFERDTIYTWRLERLGVHLTHDRTVDPLETVFCGEAMTKDPHTVHPDDKVQAVLAEAQRGRVRGFPVLDGTGALVGIVTRGDLVAAMHETDASLTIGEVMTPDPHCVHPDETVERALEKMGEHNIGRVPVVRRDDPQRCVGIVTRSDVIRAHAEQHRRLQGED